MTLSEMFPYRASRYLICGLIFLSAIVSGVLGGCATLPYQLGTGRIDQDSPRSPVMKQQIYVGRPHGFIDASDWIWPGSLLAKLLLWDKDVDSHEVSQETIEAVMKYIEKNDLRNVQILINQYSPGIQWKRLFTNRTVGAGWRYTLGILSTIKYIILPGRFFGGDHYNPYTNTVSIYSNDPAIALHEVAHAKDFGRRNYKGSHAFLYALPFASLYYEAAATGDVLDYLHEEREWRAQKDAYEILVPAYASYISGNISGLYFDPLSVTVLSAVFMGHMAGQAASVTTDAPDAEPKIGPLSRTDTVQASSAITKPDAEP